MKHVSKNNPRVVDHFHESSEVCFGYSGLKGLIIVFSDLINMSNFLELY